jgi:hypothetical protein
VEFYLGKKLLAAKSRDAGREIYEDREYVRIQIKGQDKQVVVHEVTEQYKRKFPIAYQLFQMGKPQPVVGTPIEQLPGMGPSLAHHLRGIALRTIEDIAGVSDENTINRIGMGARELVKKAQAFIAQSTQKEVSLEQENADLKKQLADLAQRMETLEKPKRAKRQGAP